MMLKRTVNLMLVATILSWQVMMKETEMTELEQISEKEALMLVENPTTLPDTYFLLLCY